MEEESLFKYNQFTNEMKLKIVDTHCVWVIFDWEESINLKKK